MSHISAHVDVVVYIFVAAARVNRNTKQTMDLHPSDSDNFRSADSDGNNDTNCIGNKTMIYSNIKLPIRLKVPSSSIHLFSSIKHSHRKVSLVVLLLVLYKLQGGLTTTSLTIITSSSNNSDQAIGDAHNDNDINTTADSCDRLANSAQDNQTTEPLSAASQVPADEATRRQVEVKAEEVDNSIDGKDKIEKFLKMLNEEFNVTSQGESVRKNISSLLIDVTGTVQSHNGSKLIRHYNGATTLTQNGRKILFMKQAFKTERLNVLKGSMNFSLDTRPKIDEQTRWHILVNDTEIIVVQSLNNFYYWFVSISLGWFVCFSLHCSALFLCCLSCDPDR